MSLIPSFENIEKLVTAITLKLCLINNIKCFLQVMKDICSKVFTPRYLI